MYIIENFIKKNKKLGKVKNVSQSENADQYKCIHNILYNLITF